MAHESDTSGPVVASSLGLECHTPSAFYYTQEHNAPDIVHSAIKTCIYMYMYCTWVDKREAEDTTWVARYSL